MVSALVARVPAQVEKIFDDDVPCFEITADRPTLVHGDGGIIGDLEEWHGTEALAVVPLMRAHSTQARPIIAQAARPLGEQSVVRIDLKMCARSSSTLVRTHEES